MERKQKSIVCGNDHTFLITKNENIYVFGRSDYGQLGLGDKKDRNKPTKLKLPKNEKIKYLECGGYHTILITKNEKNYVFGSNSNGQLGLGDKKDRNKPTLLKLPNNEKIKPFIIETWNKLNHKYSSNKTKLIIKTILILSLRNKETYKPKYSKSLIYLLPRDIIFEIFQYLDL